MQDWMPNAQHPLQTCNVSSSECTSDRPNQLLLLQQHRGHLQCKTDSYSHDDDSMLFRLVIKVMFMPLLHKAVTDNTGKVQLHSCDLMSRHLRSLDAPRHRAQEIHVALVQFWLRS